MSTFAASCIIPLQPELTVENLPSFLSLGKALLLLFVGEEEDAIGLRQNQALLKEMKSVVQSGWRNMERYLASWIHLYVHPSTLAFNQYETLSALSPSITRRNSTLKDLSACVPAVGRQLVCPSWGHTLAPCLRSLRWFSPICPLVARSISSLPIPPLWLPLCSSGCRGWRTELRNQQVRRGRRRLSKKHPYFKKLIQVHSCYT